MPGNSEHQTPQLVPADLATLEAAIESKIQNITLHHELDYDNFLAHFRMFLNIICNANMTNQREVVSAITNDVKQFYDSDEKIFSEFIAIIQRHHDALQPTWLYLVRNGGRLCVNLGKILEWSERIQQLLKDPKVSQAILEKAKKVNPPVAPVYSPEPTAVQAAAPSLEAASPSPAAVRYVNPMLQHRNFSEPIPIPTPVARPAFMEHASRLSPGVRSTPSQGYASFKDSPQSPIKPILMQRNGSSHNLSAYHRVTSALSMRSLESEPLPVPAPGPD